MSTRKLLMREWKSITVINETPEQIQDGTSFLRCVDAYNAVKPKRAEIIEAAISVENALEEVLLDLFVESQPEMRVVLKELVLAAEFCTTAQKLKMFGKLFNIVPTYFESSPDTDGKRLRRELHEINAERNKFAHGELLVDARDFSVSIKYYEGGTKLQVVSDEFLIAFLRKCHDVRHRLGVLHRAFVAAEAEAADVT